MKNLSIIDSIKLSHKENAKRIKEMEEKAKKENKNLPFPKSYNVGDFVKAKATIAEIKNKALVPKTIEFKGEIASKEFKYLPPNKHAYEKAGYWIYNIKIEHSEKIVKVPLEGIIEVYFNNFGIR